MNRFLAPDPRFGVVTSLPRRPNPQRCLGFRGNGLFRKLGFAGRVVTEKRESIQRLRSTGNEVTTPRRVTTVVSNPTSNLRNLTKMPKPLFVQYGSNTYINFDRVVRGQVGQNMRGMRTVRLFDNANHEIAEVLEDAFLQAVEIANREAQ